MTASSSKLSDLVTCLYVFQFFGLQSFSIEKQAEMSKKLPNWKFTLYFILLFLFVCAKNYIEFVLVKNHFIQADDSKVMLNNLLEVAMLLTLFVMTGSSLILSFASTYYQRQVFVSLDKISSTLETKFGFKLSFKQFKRRFLFKKIVLLIFCRILLFVLNYFENYTSAGPRNYVLMASSSILIILSIGFLFVFYADIVNFLLVTLMGILVQAEKFRLTLKSLENTKKSTEQIIGKTSDFDSKLTAIKSIYLMVYETTELINKSIGKQILLCVIIDVLCLTIGGYKCSLAILMLRPWQNVAGYLLFTILPLSFLFLIVHSADKLTSSVSFFGSFFFQIQRLYLLSLFQIKNLKTILYKMEFSPNESDAHNLNRDFCLQLLSQPINFTASSFYSINYTFLASVIWEILPY